MLNGVYHTDYWVIVAAVVMFCVLILCFCIDTRRTPDKAVFIFTPALLAFFTLAILRAVIGPTEVADRAHARGLTKIHACSRENGDVIEVWVDLKNIELAEPPTMKESSNGK